MKHIIKKIITILALAVAPLNVITASRIDDITYPLIGCICCNLSGIIYVLTDKK